MVRFSFRFALVILAALACASPVQCKVIYVKPDSPSDGPGNDWSHACHTVAAGLAAATSDDEVWVAAGLYKERITLKDGVALYGGFAGSETALGQRDPSGSAAVLDGEQLGTVVTVPSGCGTSTRLDGFTIQNGKATYGGGLYSVSASPTVAGNVFRTNTGSLRGGGMYVSGGMPAIVDNSFESNVHGGHGAGGGGGIALAGGCDGSVTRNTFSANSSDEYGGGVYCTDSSPDISTNVFRGNSAYDGAGIYCSNGAPSITENVVEGNAWGGIYCHGGSPLIARNLVSRNTHNRAHAYATGIACVSATPQIVSNTVTGNTNPAGYGAGIAVVGSGTVSGNLIIGNFGQQGAGLYCAGTSTISSNRIVGNTATAEGGGIYYAGTSGTIANNTLSSNFSQTKGGAVYCSANAAPAIVNNTIVNNSAVTDGGAVYLSAATTIANCVVAFNSSGVYGVSSALARNSCAWQNGPYDFKSFSSTTGCVFQDPKLASTSLGDLHLQADSPCRDTGSNTYLQAEWTDMDGQPRVLPGGGNVDIGADESDGTTWAPAARIVRVSTDGDDSNDGADWAHAKRTVQTAIDTDLINPVEVWVRSGVYEERIRLRPYAWVYGGFRGTESSLDQRDADTSATILDGQQGGSVVVAEGISINCAGLDGFTITNGKAKNGSGIWLRHAAPFITNNVITRNCTLSASSAGYGIAIYCENSSPRIVGNTISNNDALFSYAGIANIGIAGVSSDSSSSPFVARNTVVGNRGVGLMCGGSSFVSSNRVIGNSSTAIVCSGSSTVCGNVVSGNSCESGAGIMCHDLASVVNNTIVGNAAAGGGGIWIGSYYSGTMANNIVAFNSTGIYRQGTSGTPGLAKNCVYGNTKYDYSGIAAGQTDISVDPKLASTLYGDAHIQPDSPCVNAGDNTVVQAGWTDIDGQARTLPVGGTVDIGADESDGNGWTAVPVVVRVSPDGNDGNDGSDWAHPMRSIGKAVLRASALGGEVWAKSGTYDEQIHLLPYAYLYGGFSGDETERSQRDWNTNETIIDGGQAGSVLTAQTGAMSGCIDGFTITNGRADKGGGINCTYSSPTIAHNRIIGNIATSAADGGGGIYCEGASPLVANNEISNNVARNGGAIFGKSSSPQVISNTMTSNCAIDEGGAIHSGTGGTTRVANCIIAFNSSGISSSTNGVFDLKSNCLFGNTRYDYRNTDGGIGDVLADPLLVASTFGKLRIQPRSPCVDSGDNSRVQSDWTDIDGNSRIYPESGVVDIGADESDGLAHSFSPRIVRVSPGGDDANDGSSWDSSKQHVQAAIDALSSSGGEVWAREGTYYERLSLAGFVHVYGGFAGGEEARSDRNVAAHRSTIDGQQGGSVVTATSASYLTSTIDGFRITNGLADYGGGVYCDAGSPVIANNEIVANSATAIGGGIYMESCTPTIRGNRISDCWAKTSTGGIYGIRASCIIDKNRITCNVCDPYDAKGGICTLSSSPIINGNIVAGNTGKGVYCTQAATAMPPVISNNVIANNSGTGLAGGKMLAANNTIVSNARYSAEGVYCSDGSVLVNNLIAFNGIGVKQTSGALAARNNCVYGNLVANYSGVTDPTGTDGNISADPRLTAAAYGEMHIRPDSPCVDAGDSTAVAVGWTDIDGQPRVLPTAGTVDIGADESDGVTRQFVPSVIHVSPIGDDASDGLGWLTAKRTVQAGVDAAFSLGGEVWVAGGTYAGPVTAKPYASLFGGFTGTETERSERDWDANVTLIDGMQTGSAVRYVGCHDGSLDGFTLTNGNAKGGGGVNCEYSGALISHNVITGNTGSTGGGIRCNYGAATISHNEIIGNNANYDGGVICTNGPYVISNNILADNRCSSGSSALSVYSGQTIVNNTVVGNSGPTSSSAAVRCSSGASVVIANNIVAFNSYGISWPTSSVPTMASNCVYGNTSGNHSSSPPADANTILRDPQFANRIAGDFHLRAASPCVNAGNSSALNLPSVDWDGQDRVQGASVDIGADESYGETYPSLVFRVSKSSSADGPGNDWEHAFRSLSTVMGIATAGDEVWIAAGTYQERLVLKEGARVIGGFAGTEASVAERNRAANTTVIDGGGSQTACYASDLLAPTSLEALTIRNGRATGGGGVYSRNSALSLSECKIADNMATSYGGNVYCSGGTIDLRNCLITKGSAVRGGGIYSYNSSLSVRNCAVADNAASEGSVYCAYGTQALTDTIIAHNQSGVLASSCTPVLNSCCLFGNTAYDYSGFTLGPGNVLSDPLFVKRGQEYHIQPGSPCIDAGSATGAPAADIDGVSRPRDGNCDGTATTDIGCYESPNCYASIAGAKALADGSAVGIAWPVTTCSLNGRYYVESEDRAAGIGVLGDLPDVGKRLLLEGTMTTLDGERMLQPSYVLEGSDAPVPQPWLMNTNALGGGPCGLQSGVWDWRPVRHEDAQGQPYWLRELYTYGGASNIGLLVKTTGHVSSSGAGFLYIDEANTFDDGDVAIKGVRVDWPFAAEPPSEGALVEIVGISSCRISGGQVTRLLRPISAESVRIID